MPGDRPDRARTAAQRGARTLVLDLEDAVAPERKAAARAAVVETVRQLGGQAACLVRVNAADDPAVQAADLAALAEVAELVTAVVLPKVVSVDQVRTASAALGALRLVPTVETAAGVRAAWDVAAASPLVHTLLFGPVDLGADIGVTPTAAGAELATARSLVVLACAAAGIHPPIDGPHLGLDDEQGLTVSARVARDLGFGGKVAIHPRQIAAIRAAFAPSASEVEWAEEVVRAAARAAAESLAVARLADGTFVDAPVVTRARSILAAVTP
ncbi:HpcH/HpaI aldolase/citrate lyase family protein [Pseudonocardia pini]|uniref:HpcH/HpaI aldolase/citrate lyase family protein n=1 Tax=Pseudonocardia pini TaxID=2758030 RepID=UPI0028B1DFE3|nr:aldolase/citrate lyase family protein [Pseudonocardia pini]